MENQENRDAMSEGCGPKHVGPVSLLLSESQKVPQTPPICTQI